MPLAHARSVARRGAATTFPLELEVTLEPGIGGIFEVLLDDAPIFSRAERRRFPEPKELKQKIRDAIAPGRDLGHSESAVAELPDAEQKS
jgi:selenoprotein W-related protein